MPNWCSASYVVTGDKEELRELNDLMEKLECMNEPKVPNGFGTRWLGCLVHGLGAKWDEMHCRGEWSDRDIDGKELHLNTETAWGPCDEVFDLVCSKYPSLHYYYQAEECGMGIYVTNDREGKFFPERFLLEVHPPHGDYLHEYVMSKDRAFAYLSEIVGHPVTSENDLREVQDLWDKEDEEAYCYLYEFEIEH